MVDKIGNKVDKFRASLDAMSDKEFSHQEAILGKSLHLIKSELVQVFLKDINIREDWQPRSSTDPSRLFNAICLEGLATPPKVWLDTDGVYNALVGRHRWSSLFKIEAERPEVFRRHQFDKGIPCQVYKDLTPEQVLDLRTDEGRGQEPLANKIEAFNALLPHYEILRSDAQIQAGFWKIIVDTCCSPSKRAEIYSAFRKAVNPRDFMSLLHNATRVHQQRFRYLFNCPKIIRDQWVKGELGTVTEDGVAAYKLTDKDLRELSQAVKADKAEDEASGFEKNYGFKNPGPGVKTMFSSKMAEKAAKGTSKKPESPMSKQERDNHITDGKSRAEKIIFSAVAGNPNSLAQLSSVLDQISLFDSAEKIDGDTVREVLMAIKARNKPLTEKARLGVLDYFKGGANDVDAPEPKTKKTKVKTK